MVRPTPETLLEATVECKTYAVFRASTIYAVFYKDGPVNLCALEPPLVKKYCRIAFANPGHARNLAKKMNKLFGTTEFRVFELTPGMMVSEE